MRRSLVVLAALLAGCATVHGPSEAAPAAHADASGGEEHGVASYYGTKLAGHKTASGERYDPDKLTAAHRTLPFGTIVEVTREDGRSVRVRINDRGPYGKGRVIDLSHRAAKEIGLIRDGIAAVTLTVVSGSGEDP